MDLRQALNVHPGELVSFIGASSRTVVAWRLLRLMVAAGERVVFTTTTRIPEPRGAPLILAPDPEPGAIVRGLTQFTALVLAAAREEATGALASVDQAYLLGISPHTLNDLSGRLPGVTWLVDAGETGARTSGQRGSSIPHKTRCVVVTAGIEAIGQPIERQMLDLPESAVRLLEVDLGAIVSPEMIAALVGHTADEIKGAYVGSDLVVLLTQRAARAHPFGEAVARRVLDDGLARRVALVGLSVADPVLGVWP